MSETVTHKGGCHCGAVAFEFEAAPDLDVVRCNCSICSATGFLHYFVPQAQVRFGAGSLEAMTDYQFGTRSAHHTFCSICGIKSIYIPRSHPGSYSVNVNCLDKANIKDIRIKDFDGQNWEKNIAELRED